MHALLIQRLEATWLTGHDIGSRRQYNGEFTSRHGSKATYALNSQQAVKPISRPVTSTHIDRMGSSCYHGPYTAWNRPLVRSTNASRRFSPCSQFSQPTVSRSSAEAEYRLVANIVAETCWLGYLLGELRVSIPKATVVFLSRCFRHLYHGQSGAK